MIIGDHMKKFVFLLFLASLLLAPLFLNKSEAEFVGTYGQFFTPEDTVRIIIAIHDTTGLDTIHWDSSSILRYYRSTRIDSLDEANGAVSTLARGLYQIKFKADPEGTYTNASEDSIGQFTVAVRAWVKGHSGIKVFNYQVLRGNGLYGIFDMGMFLGAGDSTFRVLYPVGTYPKDSVQYKRIADADNSGTLNAGDTLHICTTYFYHSNISRVMDSSKTVFFRNDL